MTQPIEVVSQPLDLTADAKACLVHVLDRRTGYQVTHRGDEILQPAGAGPAGRWCGDRPDAEQANPAKT